MNYIYSLLIIVSVSLSACTSRQLVSISEFQEIPSQSPPIELVSVNAQDASFQDLAKDDSIAKTISHLASKKGFTITNQPSKYRASFQIKESKFEKDLNTYFSVWMSFDIRDIKNAVVMRIILINTNTESLQSSNHLYSLLNTMITSLSKKWLSK